mgnify:FL=1
MEEYGIGLRKEDTELTQKVNEAMQALIEDGTLNELAVEYGLEAQLLANQ